MSSFSKTMRRYKIAVGLLFVVAMLPLDGFAQNDKEPTSIMTVPEWMNELQKGLESRNASRIRLENCVSQMEMVSSITLKRDRSNIVATAEIQNLTNIVISGILIELNQTDARSLGIDTVQSIKFKPTLPGSSTSWKKVISSEIEMVERQIVLPVSVRDILDSEEHEIIGSLYDSQFRPTLNSLRYEFLMKRGC